MTESIKRVVSGTVDVLTAPATVDHFQDIANGLKRIAEAYESTLNGTDEDVLEFNSALTRTAEIIPSVKARDLAKHKNSATIKPIYELSKSRLDNRLATAYKHRASLTEKQTLQQTEKDVQKQSQGPKKMGKSN